MLGLESLIMSVVQSTDLLVSIEGIMAAIAALTTTAGTLIVYVINKKASISKKELSERDKQIQEVAKLAMAGMQKAVENIGENRESLQAVYEEATTPEQREYVNQHVVPKIDRATERIEKGNGQAIAFKKALVDLLGPEADVDKDTTLPRESAGVSQSLRTVVTAKPLVAASTSTGVTVSEKATITDKSEVDKKLGNY